MGPAYDPRRGYGAGTRAVLALISAGVPAAEASARAFGGRGSLGIGAAMHVAPVASRYADDHEAYSTRRVAARA
jgi:ADP-ribosylglycohydrolase